MKIHSSEMRNGPQGRDPDLLPDIEHWSIVLSQDWHGIRVPAHVPVTVDVSVRFSDRESALDFERKVRALLAGS